jgi:hypothetical protein
MDTDTLILAKTRIKESLYQKAIVKVTMRKKIKTWNHSLRKNVLIVGIQVLEHKFNVKGPMFVKYIALLPLN